VARQPARQETVDGAVSTPDTSDGEGAMDDEEAVTSTKKLHEVGIIPTVRFICSCVSEGGWRADESLENKLSSIKSPATYGRVYTCCALQLVDVAIPFKQWKKKQK